MVMCIDCGGEASLGIFDGARIRRVCEACSVTRCHGALPEIILGDGWVIGHAAQTNRAFRYPWKDRLEMFAWGAFRQVIEGEELMVLGINHECCRCKDPGRAWQSEPREALIDWSLVLASTRDRTLLVAEDLFGLFFAAQFPTDACVSTADSEPLNIHQAIARGQCLGLSLHNHGGNQRAGPGIPRDVFVYARMPIPEISLILPPLTSVGSPGTWVMPAGRAAMEGLYDRLRHAGAELPFGEES